jgi:transposase
MGLAPTCSGLLRSSFVPPAPLRDLRELTRYRRQLIQEHTREANRVQKVLEHGEASESGCSSTTRRRWRRRCRSGLESPTTHGGRDHMVLANPA